MASGSTSVTGTDPGIPLTLDNSLQATIENLEAENDALRDRLDDKNATITELEDENKALYEELNGGGDDGAGSGSGHDGWDLGLFGMVILGIFAVLDVVGWFPLLLITVVGMALLIRR